MRHRAHAVLILASAIALSSCGSTESVTSTSSELTTTVIAGGPVAGILGQGWDAVTEEMRGQCLDPTNTIVIPNQQASLNFNASLAHSQVAEQLGFTFSGKARFRLFSGEAKANFARATSGEDLSLAMYYSADYMTGTVQLDQTRYSFLYPTDGAGWYVRCGDQFMSRKDVGGRLWLLYRIDFDTATTKQEFAATVGVSFAAGNVNSEIQAKASRFVNRAWVHVEAFQEGGDVLQLAQVVGGTVDPASAARVILDCTMSNLGPCGTFMANGIAYASTTFQSSLATRPGDRVYTFVDYGVATPPPPAPAPPAVRAIPDSVREARRSLVSRHDANIALQDRIRALNGVAAASVNTALRSQLPTYDAIVQNNLRILQESKPRCWDELDPTNPALVSACVSAGDLARLRSLGYDDTTVTMSKLETSVRQGVHRSWNNKYHFYSLDPTEGASVGYRVEYFNYFYLEKSARQATVPFYRCELPGGSHLYTTSPNCENAGTNEGSLGYISPTPLPDTTALYRMFRPRSGDHFYTTSYAEMQSAKGSGYYFEWIAGYVWLQP